MKYNNVHRVTGRKVPAYFLGRPRSFYCDETTPAVPLAVVRGHVDTDTQLALAA
jgi:hypothetical protein